MNQMRRVMVHRTGFQAAPFRPRSDLPPLGIDFWGAATDTFYIYSPSDTPQGLRRGSVFLALPGSLGSAWEAPHAH